MTTGMNHGAGDARPYEFKRLVLDPAVLRGSLALRAATARRRAQLAEAIERERRFLESSASYREAVSGRPAAADLQHRIELDGLTWWVPVAATADPASIARVVSHQDFPYRVIVQTREVSIGGIMLDIGSNVGRMSIPRVILGDVRAAYCAEPEPLNYACLVRNVRDNGLAGLVLPDRVAVGAADGTVRLVRAKSPGGHQIVAEGVQAKGETIDVPCLTLDSWCARLGLDPGDVSFVKLDAQGSEMDVLAGATRLLGCRHVAWQIEIDLLILGERGVTAEAFFDALRPHFTHWLDLNKRATGARVRPIGHLGAGLAYLRTGGGSRTDVLLFTLQDPTSPAEHT